MATKEEQLSVRVVLESEDGEVDDDLFADLSLAIESLAYELKVNGHTWKITEITVE